MFTKAFNACVLQQDILVVPIALNPRADLPLPDY